MLVLCGSEIVAKYIVHMQLNGLVGKIANTVFHYGHIALALVIFSSLMWVFHHCTDEKKEFGTWFLDYSDKYSYDVYIVHLPFILGPYSFFNNRTSLQSIVGGILLLIPTIIACAIALYFIRLVLSPATWSGLKKT